MKKILAGLLFAAVVGLSADKAEAQPVYQNPYSGDTEQFFYTFQQIDDWFDYWWCNLAPWVPACAWIPVVDEQMRYITADCTDWDSSGMACVELDPKLPSIQPLTSSVFYQYKNIDGTLVNHVCTRTTTVVDGSIFIFVYVEPEVCEIL